MNGYLMTLSLLNKRSFFDVEGNAIDQIKFKTNEGIDFYGRQTNEAPTKYIFYQLAQQGKILDNMMILISSECEEKRFDFLDNKNTYEYFIDIIKEYINNDIKNNYHVLYEQIIDTYGDIDSYLNKIIMKVAVSSKPEIDEKNDVFESLIRFITIDKEQRNLYVDFSGGSRVSGMVLLTMVRILEKQFNTNIKEVIYADINNQVKKLEVINDYYISLKALEDNAIAYKGGDIASEYLETLGMRRSSEIKHESKNLKNLTSESQKAYSDVETEEIRKKIKDESNKEFTDIIAKEMHSQALKNAKANIHNSPFSKMLNLDNKNLILDFHENLFEIMIDKKYIIQNKGKSEDFKGDVKSQLKANETYYDGQKNYRGVIQKVVEWLNKDIADYNNAFRNNINLYNKEYYSFKPKFPRGVRKEYYERFVDYLKENEVYVEGNDDYDLMKEYSRLSNIYFNYGFPFMCRGDNNKFYSEISDYYLDRVKSLFNYLENYKNNKDSEVSLLIEDVKKNGIDSELLKKRIPLMLKSELWKINNEKFNDEKEAQKFIESLYNKVEEVRPYRNAVAHNLHNEYSPIEKQEEIATKIREWLKEYEEIIS